MNQMMGTGGRKYDDLRTMWKVTMAMYVAGAATIVATFGAPDPNTSDHDELAAVAVVLLGIALASWVAGPRERPVRLSPVFGVVLVSVIVALARPIGSTPFFYLWPILAAGYYYTRPQMFATLGLFLVGFTAATVAADDGPVGTLLLIGATMSFTLAGILVNWLKRGLDGVVDELERTAASDPLTGLLNRRGLDQAFERDLERAMRAGVPLTVAVLDLDHFKQVNDRFGHAGGDDVLRALADVLRAEGRAGDTVGRTGGEEFAAVLYDADAEGALEFVRRVAAAPAFAAGFAGPLTLSAGIAELSPELSTRADMLLAADRVLYAAKAAGRARAAVHGRPPHAAVLLRPAALAA